MKFLWTITDDKQDPGDLYIFALRDTFALITNSPTEKMAATFSSLWFAISVVGIQFVGIGTGR